MSDSDTSTENDTSTDGGSILDDGGIDTDERAGRSLGIDPQAEPDEDTKKDMAEEREKRLDPDNRPDNAEVDNTPRTFDVDRGQFTDSEEYDENEPAPYVDPEDPNSSESAGDEAEGSDDSGDAEKENAS
jgi:hypothetical protein